MGLKSLFIKEDPKTAPATADADKNRPAPVPYVPPQTLVPATSEDFMTFYTQLEESLEEANLPNVQDYMDLKKALANMANLPMNEDTKIQAAFAAMATAGGNAQAFQESFDYYKNIIETEKTKFEEAFASMQSDAVLEKQKTIETLTKKNEDNATKVQQLTEETNANAQKIAQLQVEVSTDNARLEQKKANFNAAYQKVMSEIDADMAKIQKHIGALPAAPVMVSTPKSTSKKTSKKEK